MLDDLLGLDGVAQGLVHGPPFAVERPARERARAVGRGAFQPGAHQQRTLEPSAVLIATPDVHVRWPRQSEALVEHGEVARSGIEPNVENVVFLAEFTAPAF